MHYRHDKASNAKYTSVATSGNFIMFFWDAKGKGIENDGTKVRKEKEKQISTCRERVL